MTTNRKILFLTMLSTALIGFKCGSASNDDEKKTKIDKPAGFTVKVINSFPHDSEAFTQGLLFRDGHLYESTGQYGKSSLRKTDLTTGTVAFQHAVPEQYFAEGLTYWDGKFYQLTWQGNIAFAYTESANAFERDSASDFTYTTQGWGLTNDASYLIMSDGSATITFLNPETKQAVKTITVTDGVTPVANLNELEFINGKIWANIWKQNRIVVINPTTGVVEQTITVDPAMLFADTEGLESTKGLDSVLNGIAFDDINQRLFITGKLWAKVFEVEVVASP